MYLEEINLQTNTTFMYNMYKYNKYNMTSIDYQARSLTIAVQSMSENAYQTLTFAIIKRSNVPKKN